MGRLPVDVDESEAAAACLRLCLDLRERKRRVEPTKREEAVRREVICGDDRVGGVWCDPKWRVGKRELRHTRE
jgi:hypothetical protein